MNKDDLRVEPNATPSTEEPKALHGVYEAPALTQLLREPQGKDTPAPTEASPNLPGPGS